jgi:hypothetical protein
MPPRLFFAFGIFQGGEEEGVKKNLSQQISKCAVHAFNSTYIGGIDRRLALRKNANSI